MKAQLPVLVLAVLTFWSGTFVGGATAGGALTAHLTILGFCLVGAAAWRDPLALGARGRWLVLLALAIVLAGWALGPVPRAGRVGMLLLPALLLAPAALAACWSGERERNRGLYGLGVLAAAVAVTALARWQLQGSPRAAMPLGHHNLLALWLVLIWPLALLPMRRPGARRLALAGVALAALGALAASGSFLGAAALSLQALVAGIWWRRARAWLAVAVLLVWLGPGAVERTVEWWQERGTQLEAPSRPVVVHGAERAARIVTRTDTSTRARTVYAMGGWEGVKGRPLLGWGAGSVPWTIADSLAPAPGVSPPSEVVGDLHSWPLEIAYETGVAGLVTVGAIAVLFARRRWRERVAGRDPALLEAALVGLLGGGVMLLGNAPMRVLALPTAVAVAAGAALAGGTARPAGRLGSRLAVLGLYVLPAAVLLAPLERAHFAYDAARRAVDQEVALARVRRAAELDPAFPLYRARAAWLAAELEGAGVGPAEEALAAARRARHLAPLWLAAGALGLEAGRPWAEDALKRARRLDPLAPLPVFHLLRARPEGPDAIELGAFAVRGDGRLGFALFWDAHPALRDAVRERLEWETSAAGGMSGTDTSGRTFLLVQSMDVTPALSFSIFAFRRSPWPADLAPVEVRLGKS